MKTFINYSKVIPTFLGSLKIAKQLRFPLARGQRHFASETRVKTTISLPRQLRISESTGFLGTFSIQPPPRLVANERVMEEYSAPPCFKCKIFNISQERSEVTRLGNFLSHPTNFRNYRRALHTGLSGIIVMDRRRVEQSLKDLSIRRDHSFRILGIFQREIWEI